MKTTLTVLLLALGIVLAGADARPTGAVAEDGVNAGGDAGGKEAADAPAADVAGAQRTISSDLAFIDVAKVLNGHRKSQRWIEKVKARVTAFEREFMTERDEVNKLCAKFEKADPQDKPDIEKEMIKRMAAATASIDLHRNKFLHEAAQFYNAFCDDLYEEVAHYAREQGLRVVCSTYPLLPAKRADGTIDSDAVLERMNQLVVFPAVEQRRDITQEVLQRLNRMPDGADAPPAESPAASATDAATDDASAGADVAVVDVQKLFQAHRGFNQRLDELKAKLAASEREARAKGAKSADDSERLRQSGVELYDETYDEFVADVAHYAKQHGLRVVLRTAEPEPQERKGTPGLPYATVLRVNQPILYPTAKPQDITQAILQQWVEEGKSKDVKPRE